jgi:hypothetical protein
LIVDVVPRTLGVCEVKMRKRVEVSSLTFGGIWQLRIWV